MQLVETRAELNRYLQEQGADKSIGFVPTMGALHRGHLSLINRSKNENDVTICSVFVNPRQFNNPDDLNSYPRDFDADYKKLSAAKCDVMFHPSYEEVYPEPVGETLALNGMDAHMEGQFRPGHFDGVVTVIRQFLNMIPADKAYFGLKDYQQYAIIKFASQSLGFKTEIVGCPTERDASGLALSSRNELLTDNGIEMSSYLFHSLKQALEMIKTQPVSAVKKAVVDLYEQMPDIDLEYFEIADSDTLMPLEDHMEKKHCIACLAAYVEGVRLIDNLILIP